MVLKLVWDALNYSDIQQGVQAQDEFRKVCMINALSKFGWRLAWRYENGGVSKVLPKIRHYENHHHHLQVEKYLPMLIEVVE